MARHYRIGGGPMLWARTVAASTAPISRLWGDIVGQDGCQPAVDAVLLSLGRYDATDVRRQVRFDPLPLLVAQPEKVPAHDANPLPKENQNRIVPAEEFNEF
jgi:hypothetical protein